MAHGATTGCAKCFSALEKGWGHHGGSHSPECLARFRSIYSNTEAGRLRLERAEQRLVRRTAREKSATENAAEAAKTQWRDVAGGEQTPVTPPLRDPAASDEEPKCPTSDEEGDAAMKDWEATSAESDEEMPPVDAVGALEIEILQLVEHLGGSREKYSRQQHQAKQAITEVYSPPRVTEWAKKLPGYGIVIGFAFDLITRDDNGVPWDFDLAERREAARRFIAEQKPLFLVGSPMCTAFCTWQRINATRRDPKVV